MRRSLIFSVVLAVLVWQVVAQEPIGIFDDHQDVGEPFEFGYATYDAAADRYSVEGVGETIGDETFVDQFHYVFSQMTGSFAIEAIPTPDVSGRGGLMIRQSLDADAVHVSFLMASDFSVFPTFRTLKGGATIRDGDPEPAGLTPLHTGKIRLERLGNSIHLYTFDENGNEVYIQTEVAPMNDPVFAGLAVSAESGTGIAFFEFEEVAIEELPFAVSRTLPTQEYQPGATLSPVTITARVREGQTVDGSIHEVLPRGSTLSNLQASAGEVTINDDGTIDWVLTGFSGEATLTYDLTLGQSHSAVWQGTFNDGINRESFIGGDTILPKQPAFTPRGPFAVDPVLPTLMQAEWATLVGEERFGLFVDPRTQSGITVVAIDEFAAGTSLDFEFVVPEDGTYYFFFNVRSEDGNSDSFHAEVDGIPAGDNSSRANVSSRKEFAHEWLSSYDPALDPRPFELTAGTHVLSIANREDSTSIDWVAITNNPDLDPEDYVEGSRAFVTRSLPTLALEPGLTGSPVKVEAYIATGVAENAVTTEIPPEGFTVENLKTSAGTASLNPDGSISLDLTGVTGQVVTLEYQVVAPVGKTGAAWFSGTTLVGSDLPVPTTGDGLLYFLPPGKPPTGKQAYFFRRVGLNTAGDQIFKAYMETVFGLRVADFDDTDAPGYEMPVDLSGADLAFISGSVTSGNVRDMNYHFDSPVPMVTLETWLNDDFAFQAGVGRGDLEGNAIEIIDNTHPITEGFPLGVLQVWEEPMTMGHLEDPPAGLRVLATVPGQPNLARLWVLEKGDTANGITTPGLRVGTWLGTAGFLELNSDGLRLLNQIFAYALGEEPPAAVEDFGLY